ncbi:hypothetical protein VN97_g10916 [Penicillium thymicola]|uniref:Uncharacterized protein n=1 Tax=Penicillium thymicola TaxID=293382 RepID=A0AAI9T901_PENTH|nr:hypothetical protein VN97_g10916 [Penicillium thymicola]
MTENRMTIAVTQVKTTRQRISLRKKRSVRAWRSVDFFIMQHPGGQLGELRSGSSSGVLEKSSGVPAKPAYIIIQYSYHPLA